MGRFFRGNLLFPPHATNHCLPFGGFLPYYSGELPRKGRCPYGWQEHQKISHGKTDDPGRAGPAAQRDPSGGVQLGERKDPAGY